MEFWYSSLLISRRFSYIKASVHICVASSQVVHVCGALWKLSGEVKLERLWFHVYYFFCLLNLCHHIQEVVTEHCYPSGSTETSNWSTVYSMWDYLSPNEPSKYKSVVHEMNKYIVAFELEERKVFFCW